MRIKNKEEALKYCINKGFNEEDSRFIVNNTWDYHSIDELKNTINDLEEEKKWKNRSIWKKIGFDNNKNFRFITAILIFLLLLLC